MAKNEAQKQQFIILCLWISMSIAIILLLISLYLLIYPPPSKYGRMFKDEQGKIRVQTIYSLPKPVADRSILVNWATLAVTSLNNYSAANYKENLYNAVQEFFTPEGRENFLATLQQSGVLQRVIQDKLILTSVVTGPPVILKQGMLNYGMFERKYTWKMQIPLLVTYQTFNSTTIERSKFIVTLLVVEMPTWLSKEGIGIQQYLVKKI